MNGISEAETIVKRILPYLERRGYELDNDLTFEDPVKLKAEARKGFIDILVHCGRPTPYFLIEVKRDGIRLKAEHRKQAIGYAIERKVPFVVVTNGKVFELYNSKTGKPLTAKGTSLNWIPTKTDVVGIIKQLRTSPTAEQLIVVQDRGLPFRPGIPLTKLNNLFKSCHNSVRKIEKNEESAFADFSKFLFLKLLEEKWDDKQVKPPYTYLFHVLAETPADQSDQIKTAIESMIATIRKTDYGEVLQDPIKLKNPLTYRKIVTELAKVSLSDCDLDSKGSAFEYFVRATLKGKKLGQYFTPRPLVRLMSELGRWRQIIENLKAKEPFKVLDPACGTGGFLVYTMNQCLAEVERQYREKIIHKSLRDRLEASLKQDVFYGIDANEGVACSAKMNMIVAGDGHNNIRCADSLTERLLLPQSTVNPDLTGIDQAHLILTNPPFGTSEAESLDLESRKSYAIESTRGQALFLQKMVAATRPDSRIVTVIDEGVLNTATYKEIRRHLLEHCRLEYVIRLPEETFKPNKINVRSSVLVLIRRKSADVNLTEQYPVIFTKLDSLGYNGAGEEVRGFDLTRLITELVNIKADSLPTESSKTGCNWRAFQCESLEIVKDSGFRLDLKYWAPETRRKVEALSQIPGAAMIGALNTIKTRRGDSPPSTEYVSETDGFALVVKSGSNITKQGNLHVPEDADWVERAIFEEYIQKQKLVLKDGDILLASTGDGTLGKCCVYRYKRDGELVPAIPEGHVTVIRVNTQEVYPEYLCDYLRKGFGREQLYRFFTGSTGMVEVFPEEIDRVVLPPLPKLSRQRELSKKLRDAEAAATAAAEAVAEELGKEEALFASVTMSA